MALTGDDLFTRMQRHMPELRNAGAGEKARAINHLQDAQEELIVEINNLDQDYFTRTSTADTVAGQKRYSLPNQYDSIRHLEIVTDEASDTSFPLTEIHYIPHKDWWEQLGDDLSHLTTTTNGRPLAFMQYGDWLELRPIPDAVYTMRMWFRTDATDITLAEADETVLPPAMYQALVLKACIAERVYRHQATNDLERKLDPALDAALLRISDRHDSGPKFINYQTDHNYDY